MFRAVLTLGVVFLLLAGFLAGWWFVERPIPHLDGIVSLSELAGPVRVRFDSRQVPYIEAGSEPDLYLSQGFLTARDRFFQMDMLRRLAAGRLSEIFGVSCLPQDKLARTIGCGRLAVAEVKQLSPECKAMLTSYCRGVNLYLAANINSMPLEFNLLAYRPEPWTPADTLAIMKYLSYVHDESWQLDDLRQRIGDLVGAEKTAQLFAEEATSSSNAANKINRPNVQSYWPSLRSLSVASEQNTWLAHSAHMGSSAWVVAGKNTDSGGAILGSDKDEQLTFPDLLYLTSLTAPGLHVAGATIPGIPGILTGRNDFIAWGSASLKADVQDLVLQEFSSQFPTKYKTAAGWQNAVEVNEEIPVRFSSNVVHKVLVTGQGPVLVKNGNKAIALSWTGSTTDHPSLEYVRLVNRAKNWPEFQTAMKAVGGSPQLFVYGDHSGNIGYQAAGDIPLRSGNADGTVLVAGWEPRGQWTGVVPFAQLPSVYNPNSGYLVAANQKLSGQISSVLIGHQWCAPYRAFRAEMFFSDLFSHGRKFGLPDSNELQSDTGSYLSPLVKREISQALSGAQEIDKYQLSALDLVEHWDGTLKPDSPAAAIYESFLHTLARRLLTPKLGKDLTDEYMDRWAMWPLFVERYLKEKPAKWLPPEERTYPTFILTTFSQAVNNLRLALRTDDPKQWTWQAVHKATFPQSATCGMPWLTSIFKTGPIGVGGDPDTINALDVKGDTSAGQFACRSGPTMRLLVDCSDRDKLYQSLSLGQSGHLFSSHSRDQLQAWLRVDPLPVAFSNDQIERQSQHKLILTNAPLSTPE